MKRLDYAIARGEMQHRANSCRDQKLSSLLSLPAALPAFQKVGLVPSLFVFTLLLCACLKRCSVSKIGIVSSVLCMCDPILRSVCFMVSVGGVGPPFSVYLGFLEMCILLTSLIRGSVRLFDVY